VRKAAGSCLRVVAAGVLLCAAGCVRWVHVAPAKLQLHGKAGQACSAAVTPLVWVANTVLYPVSVASLGDKTPSHDNLGYPGLAVENGAYAACTALGLPARLLLRGGERIFFLLAARESLEDHLIDRLPYLSRDDYALLVKTAGRTAPPAYDRTAAPAPTSGGGAAASREHGLWSTRQTPRFGSKPRLGNPLAAAEWRDWRAAGRPRDAEAERAFVEKRARESVAPDPPLRDRAALALATIGTATAAEELLRSLGGLSHRMRYEALRVLALSSPGRASLSSALADPDQHTRIAAAAAIGRSAVDTADPLLQLALGNDDPSVSAAAAHARDARDAAGTAR